MTDYEIYVLLLCVIVFVVLTAFSVLCVSIITKLSLRLINSGAEDQSILKDHSEKRYKKAKSKSGKIIDYVVSGVVCLVFVIMLLGSLVIRCTENSCCGELLPTYRVVKSGSMASVNKKNTYISQNGLTDQIQMFDLIKTEKLPSEDELELYDIVVYEIDGALVIHRIVGIEEANAAHPNGRRYKMQGDAVGSPDRDLVSYDQMKGIYTGERIPFIGSFILFMQSPAGWLCTILILVAMISAPMLDSKLQKARDARLKICLGASEGELVSAGEGSND